MPRPSLPIQFATQERNPRYIDPSERDELYRTDHSGIPFQKKDRTPGPVRLNPAWTDITQAKRDNAFYQFQPVQSVRCDWLLTSPDHYVIVGLEKPWDHPEAFGCRGDEI